MAKNKDDFINDEVINKTGYIKLFEHLFSIYRDNEKALKKLESIRDTILSKNENVDEVYRVLEMTDYNTSYNDILNITRLAQLYEVIKDLVDNKNLKEYNGFDLLTMKEWLENYSTVRDYVYNLEDLDDRYTTRKYVFESIDLSMNSCFEKHTFIRLPGELKCVCCGATTKDYDLTEEELDFLTECAKYQKCLTEEELKSEQTIQKKKC